jgi:ABC-type cobalt transport system substrate-binding protein
MRTATRLAALGLLVLVLSLTAMPAMGAESGGDDEEAPTTTEVVDFEYKPATIVEPPSSDPADQPWTTKFLVPTGLALAAIAVFVTVIQYFVRVVRSRYKVVE